MAAPTNIWYSNVGAVQAGNVNVLANLNDPILSGSPLEMIVATYTMTGNEVANDVIYFARIPSGSVVDIMGSVATGGGNAAATLTMSIGDTDTLGGTAAYDPARYCAATDMHAQTTTVPVAFTGGTSVAAPVEITDDWVWILGTLATLVTPSAGKTLILRVRVSSYD